MSFAHKALFLMIRSLYIFQQVCSWWLHPSRWYGLLTLALLGMLYASPAETQAQSLYEVQRGVDWIEFEVQNPDGVLSVPLSMLVEAPVRGDVEVLSTTRGMPAQNLSGQAGVEDLSAITQKAAALGISSSHPIAEVIPFAGEHSELQVSLWNGSTILTSARIRVFLDSQRPSGAGVAGRALGVRQQTGSPLATGTWVRFGIQESGLYQLRPSELTEASASFTGIDSDQLQCWGRPGVELPEVNTAPRISLQQLPLHLNDGGDGVFDGNDQAWVYVEGPSVTRVAADGNLEHRVHDSSTQTYLYCTSEGDPSTSLRMDMGAPTDALIREEGRQLAWIEEDLRKSEDKIRSGRQWLGQTLQATGAASSASILQVDESHVVPNSPMRVTSQWVGRSLAPVTVAQFVNSENAGNATIPRIFSYTSEEGASGVQRTLSGVRTFTPSNGVYELNASMSTSDASGEAFLDWARVEFRSTLTAQDGVLHFYGVQGTAPGQPVRYAVEGFESNPFALEISNPMSPRWLPVTSEVVSGQTKSVIHVDEASNYADVPSILVGSAPLALTQAELVANQNLKGRHPDADVIVVTDEGLLDAVNEWASYRELTRDLSIYVVTQEAIFHEFSAGAVDPVAIRDYIKHVWDGAAQDLGRAPKTLFLFGDATYDPRGIVESNRQNRVVTWQSEESLNRINSYGSDDFFVLLNNGEGRWSPGSSNERIDMGVGRWPVQSAQEASTLLQKLKTYESMSSKGDWRTKFTFVSDDDFPEVEINRDLHAINAEGTAEVIDANAAGLKVDRIYMLSYPVENTGGGRRVPQANADVLSAFNEGSLVMNYSGHGNQFVLADEQLFTTDVIPLLSNVSRPSIFVTATCQFGRYDDTDAQSGAEQILLTPNGGAIASFTTTRVVYTSASPGANNFGLNIQLTRAMIERDADGYPRTLGEIYRRTKNTSEGAGFNSRKFILLGDPTMRMGLPEQQLAFETLNGESLTEDPATEDPLVSLQALEEVTVTGRVIDPLSRLTSTSFNGEMVLRLFDAEREVSLPDREWVNEGRCYLENCAYTAETDLLYTGRVSVVQGEFETTFRIPRDVRFDEKPARLLGYVTSATTDGVSSTGGTPAFGRDASGSTNAFRFEGVNTEVQNDGQGPQVDVYLNSPDFVNGTLTNPNPTLFVELRDETGVNTSATGIGHEIIATIDTQPTQEIVLNDYFQANLDDYRGGRIEYPLQELPEGAYTLEVRAWDVFNNPTEEAIAFDVATSDELQIRGVANYPNPMNSFTRFYFEHNQPGVPLDVDVRIFTLSGKPVMHLRETLQTSSAYAYLEWNGRDRDYDRLANGTYLYVLRVGADTGQGRQSRQKTETLVILQ
ncbi:MAG: type IX secretion system sortase PorU [Rhodothermaceae bacterium TMED105]|nr:MAG: type IX secretion system sortase PorU [Rhodothermaceae bacterium TMED105]